MIDELNQLLKERISDIDLNKLGKQIGYQNPKKFIAHLKQHILDQPFLGLDHPQYDFRFTTEELLKALVDPLSIPQNLVDDVLSEVENGIRRYAKHQPYFFIKTDFSIEQNTQPLFVLAVLESKRRITVPFESWHSDKEQMIDYLTDWVQQHYRSKDGHLKEWGNIQAYHYHHSDGQVLVFDINGVLQTEQDPLESYAFIRV